MSQRSLHEFLNIQLFLWFKAHDWDEDDHMDGLELLKALR